MSENTYSQKQSVSDIPFVDREQVELLIKKASEDPDKHLKTHFIRSVFANLEGILQALTDDEISVKEKLSRLRQASEAVEDLAMIHGYEGIETIAGNVIQAIASADPRELDTIPEGLAVKIKTAVEAIQKVLALTDDLSEQIIVDSTTSEITALDQVEPVAEAIREAEPFEPSAEEEKLDEKEPAASSISREYTAEKSQSDDYIQVPVKTEEEEGGTELLLSKILDTESEEEDSAETEEPLFDIREATNLIGLMSEEEGQEAPAEPTEFRQSDHLDSLEVTSADVKPTAQSEIQDLFADVLRDEVREVLAVLEQLSKGTQPVRPDTLNNFSFVLESLRETADKLNEPQLADCTSELSKYVQKDVVPGKAISHETTEVFHQVQKALNEFLEDRELASTRLELLVERLQTSGSPEPAQEEQDIDDAIILELQRKVTEQKTSDRKTGLKGKLRKAFGL